MKKNILTIRDLIQAQECVFFDAAQFGTVNDASYFFSHPYAVIEAWTAQDILPALKRAEGFLNQYWLAGYMRYEAASAFFHRKEDAQKNEAPFKGPLLWFGVYSNPQKIEAFDARDTYAPLRSLRSTLNPRAYKNAFTAIKHEIQSGNTYQVNFTFDFLFHAGASAEFLYAYLRDYQRTPYCAFIKNRFEQVLSFSPELFFHRDGQRIWTCPMKGTADRGMDDENDAFKKESLRRDEKNRAENLMIVDLMRNDLGRIAQPGTVHVPSLFDVETHPTVHQMTSLIEARLKPGIDYEAIFRALFPCGSVTGAPKIKTMEIIDQVESGSRGVYCGAIGYIAPGEKAVFSVPIRILQRQDDCAVWQYRSGSGIIWDSIPQTEWDEVHTKAAFLMKDDFSDVHLLETMRWDHGAIAYEEAHIARLCRSAKKLKFVFHNEGLRAVMKKIYRILSSKDCAIVRLLMGKSGKFSYELLDMEFPEGQVCHVIGIADVCLDSENDWLQHKTTYRPWYENTIEKIQTGAVWDEVFFNQREELCEGARSNIFVQLNKTLYTPPVSCGLLPGILREILLETGQCEEKILFRQDVLSAEAVYCGNSVRGLVKVKVASDR